MNMYKLLRPVLFISDPEWAHNRSLLMLKWIGRNAWISDFVQIRYACKDARLSQEYFGLRFPNPVGLAAGFDKNGVGISAAQNLGFGFLEIGSVSNGASAGNPNRPRLHRIPKDKGIIVFYGVPNEGARQVASRIDQHGLEIPLGVNLVETNTGKEWTAEETINDIVSAIGPFIGVADYLTLNLNCPNTTGGLGPFEQKQYLTSLLQAIGKYDHLPPVWLKVTATTEEAVIDHYTETADPYSFVKGFIFNLPPGNPYQLRTPSRKLEKMRGAVSGLPTQPFMDQTIQKWYQRIDKSRWLIIGSGGVFSAEDAYRKIKLGASLIQIYTAMIYEGPGLVKRINQGLLRLMQAEGVNHISEVIGAGES